MTLRELLPKIEIDWLLPAWLLLAIVAAAIAETIIIGTGIYIVYKLQVGWSVGVVIASSQALGSILFAHNATHNGRRKIVWRRSKGEIVGENTAQSEPKLSTWQPMLVSVLSGAIAFFVALSLYQVIRGGLRWLDYMIAIASPGGSIASAILNGLFASGELALREYAEKQVKKVPVATKPVVREKKRLEKIPGKTKAAQAREYLEQNPKTTVHELKELLQITERYAHKLIAERSDNGRVQAEVIQEQVEVNGQRF